MIRHLFFIILLVLAFGQSNAQKSSFLVLGDLHYDLSGNHNMEWLANKPDDVRQVKEYIDFTKNNWCDFMGILRKQSRDPERGWRQRKARIHCRKPSPRAMGKTGRFPCRS